MNLRLFPGKKFGKEETRSIQVVNVFIGMMAEEVFALLSGYNSTENSCIVITRSNIANQNQLLEQYLTLYSGLDAKSIAVTTNPPKSNSGLVIDLLNGINTETESVDEELKLMSRPNTKTKMAGPECIDKNNRSIISAVKLGTGKVGNIFLQLPEMGFQSDISYLYAKAMINAISDVYKCPMRLCMYGAGGAVGEKNTGDVVDISAALSVTVHLDRSFMLSKLLEKAKVKKIEPGVINKTTAVIEASKASQNYYEKVDQSYYQLKEKLRNKYTKDEFSTLMKELEKEKNFYGEVAVSTKDEKTILFRSQPQKDNFVAQEIACSAFFKLAGKELDLNLASTPYLAEIHNTDNYRKLSGKIKELNTQFQKRSEKIKTLSSEILFLEESYKKHGEEYKKLTEVEKQAFRKWKSSRNEETFLEYKKASIKAYNFYLKKILSYYSDKTAKQTVLTAETFLRSSTLNEINSLITQQKELEQQAVEYVNKKRKEGYWSGDTTKEEMKNLENKKTVANTLDLMQKKINDNVTSLCGSLYLSEGMKKAASDLIGEGNEGAANMEDDKLLDIYRREAQSLKSYKDYPPVIIRACCDPATIPEGLGTKLEEWTTKKVNYTLSQYADAIMWRLSGYKEEFLTTSLNWGFVDDVSENEKKIFFSQKDASGGDIVIDPFLREVGTDFLADFIKYAKKNLGETKEVKEKIEQINEKFISSLKESKEMDQQTKEELHKLIVEVVKDILIILKLNKSERDAFDENNTDAFEFFPWVRSGSWGGNLGFKLSDASFRYGSNTDRALYVGSNVGVLLANRDYVFMQLIKPEELKPEGGEKEVEKIKTAPSPSPSLTSTSRNMTLSPAIKKQILSLYKRGITIKGIMSHLSKQCKNDFTKELMINYIKQFTEDTTEDIKE